MTAYRALKGRFNGVYVIQRFNGDYYEPVYRGESVLSANCELSAMALIKELIGS